MWSDAQNVRETLFKDTCEKCIIHNTLEGGYRYNFTVNELLLYVNVLFY